MGRTNKFSELHRFNFQRSERFSLRHFLTHRWLRFGAVLSLIIGAFLIYPYFAQVGRQLDFIGSRTTTLRLFQQNLSEITEINHSFYEQSTLLAAGKVSSAEYLNWAKGVEKRIQALQLRVSFIYDENAKLAELKKSTIGLLSASRQVISSTTDLRSRNVASVAEQAQSLRQLEEDMAFLSSRNKMVLASIWQLMQ